MRTDKGGIVSLVDELKEVIRHGMRMDIAAFVVEHQDAILAALRGRDEVLEEAAKKCENAGWLMDVEEFREMTKRQHLERACHECAAAIRAMKEGKHGNVS